MLVNYSRTDSLTVAIEKTFDGEHPCSMCTQIREGRQEERQRNPPQAVPALRAELALAARDKPLVFVQSPTATVPSYRSRLHTNFRSAPPKPPPRLA